MIADLPPGVVRALRWWARDGVVHADVPALTKTALVRRNLAEWIDGDDLCPRLTELGIEIRELLRNEPPAPVSERTGP